MMNGRQFGRLVWLLVALLGGWRTLDLLIKTGCPILPRNLRKGGNHEPGLVGSLEWSTQTERQVARSSRLYAMSGFSGGLLASVASVRHPWRAR